MPLGILKQTPSRSEVTKRVSSSSHTKIVRFSDSLPGKCTPTLDSGSPKSGSLSALSNDGNKEQQSFKGFASSDANRIIEKCSIEKEKISILLKRCEERETRARNRSVVVGGRVGGRVRTGRTANSRSTTNTKAVTVDKTSPFAKARPIGSNTTTIIEGQKVGNEDIVEKEPEHDVVEESLGSREIRASAPLQPSVYHTTTGENQNNVMASVPEFIDLTVTRHSLADLMKTETSKKSKKPTKPSESLRKHRRTNSEYNVNATPTRPTAITVLTQEGEFRVVMKGEIGASHLRHQRLICKVTKISSGTSDDPIQID